MDKIFPGGITVTTVIMCVMAVFALIGTIDRIIGNKSGYGEQLENGVKTVGPLILVMAATYAAAPLLASVLTPIASPIYSLFGADPAMCAGTVLAVDMGGYPLAYGMTDDVMNANFSGVILGSTMGAMLVGTLPIAVTYLKDKDKSIFSYGMLIGIVTVPIGCIAGGLVMGMSFVNIIKNLIPLLILDVIIAAGLIFFQKITVKIFSLFASAVTILIAVLFALAAVQYMTGIRLPVFSDMFTSEDGGITRFDRGLLICAQIGIILAGAFPMFAFLSNKLDKPFSKLGDKMGINKDSVVGIIANFANAIAMFNLFDKMDDKGKLINIAGAVSLSYVLGDHLAFVAGVNGDMMLPMLVTKFTAGISAIILANLLSGKILKNRESKA